MPRSRNKRNAAITWHCPLCDNGFSNKRYFDSHLPKNPFCGQFYNQNIVHINPQGTPFDPNPETRAPVALQPRQPPSSPATSLPSGTLQEVYAEGDHGFGNNEDDFAYDGEEAVHLAQNAGDEDLALFDGVSPNQLAPPELRQEREPYSQMFEQFTQYCKEASINNACVPDDLAAAIELMDLLNKEGAPTAAYDSIMSWHEKHGNTKKVSENELYTKLRRRHNMQDLVLHEVRTHLPFSDLTVKIPCHDAGAMLRDLLTDPRILDQDYLFFDDNPEAPPPPDHQWNELRDINTGMAFRRTYDKLIRQNPRTSNGRVKVLCPLIPYMDGCVTGQFQNLQLEIVKFTLGVFNGKARDKGIFWRNLGAVPNYSKSKSQAKENMRNSAHRDARTYLSDSESEDEPENNRTRRKGKIEVLDAPLFDPTDYVNTDDGRSPDEEDFEEAFLAFMAQSEELPATKAQDLHCMLHAILASYKKIQDTGGIEWDLRYKGKDHYLQLIPFVLFVKGDGVEHDKHCGKYGSRTKGVAQLCRHCCCPTELTDRSDLRHNRKTKDMIVQLVREKNHEELKKLSQNYVWNAWYELRFGQHNNTHIHGATPMEIIHWIQLGMFKYSRENLFEKTGEGKLGKSLDVIATQMGFLLSRQSTKDLPRTKFTNGVMKGKLMAHEMSGVMLVLVAALVSTAGQNLLLNAKMPMRQEEDSAQQEQETLLPNGKRKRRKIEYHNMAQWLSDWI